MAIQIEKGIPVPVAPTRAKYPFASMEVGDSFAVPMSGDITSAGKNGPCDKTSLRVRSAACTHQHRNGSKYIVRSMKDEGVVRCWRVA